MATALLKPIPEEPRPEQQAEAGFLVPERSTYLRTLLTFLKARRGTWAAILVASLALNLCGLVAPRITQGILDRVIPTEDLALLAQLLLILFLVTAAQIALTLWRRLTLVRLSLQIDHRSLGQLCGHLLALPLAFFYGRRPGDLLGRCQGHGHIRHLLVGGLTRTAVDALMVVAYVVVMFAYSIQLALLVLTLAALFAAYTLWLSPVLKKQHQRLMENSAAQEAHLIEALVGMGLVKALAVEPELLRRWQGEYEKTLVSNYRTQKLRQILESGGTAIQFLSTLVILGYGTVLVVHGDLTAGQLVAFGLYAAQALTPLLGLITLWDEVQQARAALERIEEIVIQEPEVLGCVSRQIKPVKVTGHVQVEDVHFEYGAGVPVLKGVSFEVFPGQCVAVVGRTGSGKSTLARLLLRLFTPNRGRILVDGHDLADLDLAAYRRQVGTVLQENLLVTGTIRENIALGDLEPNEERVNEAARLAGAHGFIMSLPLGYETVVGELGFTLSGGQRQQINLARALYRDPHILVLDEPTSALDQLSREELRRNLPAILAGRTVFLITHQRGLEQHADRILVLDEGTIGEEGCHEELMAKRGLYYELLAASQESGAP